MTYFGQPGTVMSDTLTGDFWLTVPEQSGTVRDTLTRGLWLTIPGQPGTVRVITVMREQLLKVIVYLHRMSVQKASVVAGLRCQKLWK